MTAPSHLTVEYATNPIGIDEPRPRLAWRLQAGKQAAYRVLAASSQAALAQDHGDLWDSGKVASDVSTHVEYAGQALASATRAYWKVRVWDDAGKESAWSEPAFFETGLRNAFDWKGQWIASQAPADGDANVSAAWHLRRAFTLDKPVASARLYASARGIYVPFLNGRGVAQDFFRPGWTEYAARIQYQTYDVTEQVKQGANTLGLMLARGWYAGEVAWTSAVWGKGPSVIAQLVVTHTDGTQTTIATDGSWKAADGHIVATSFLHGETVDYRRGKSGWADAGFDDAAWKAARVVEPPTAALVAQVGPSVRQVAELAPIVIASGSVAGTYLVDFGQNLVGFVRLRVTGRAGQTIIVRHAEILENPEVALSPEGPRAAIYTTNLRRAKAADQYTLRGDTTPEVLEPMFTFHGFRYAEISGLDAPPEPGSISAVVLASDCARTGEFSCGVEMLNQLQHNIEWGQRGNFLEVPTDCPQRDERLGWMGDIQVFARTATFNADVAAFLSRWLVDLALDQSPEGSFTDVVPKMPMFMQAAPAWGDAGCIVPWVLYERYADSRVLARQFDSMRRWVDFLHTHNRDLLWKNKRGNDYGDWLSIKADTPREVLATAYFAYSTQIVADAARVLGNAAAEQHYRALWENIRAAFNKAYVTDEGKVQGETQTCYLLALHFGLLPEALRAKAARHLVADIHARNDHLSTGFVGVSYLLPTLADHGYFDLAVKLLMNDTFPSWGYSIRHGATTIWERWDGWTADKGFQDAGMNSFNHYAYGSCGDFMYRYLGGINVDIRRPGYKHIVLRPRVHQAIKHVTCRHESMHGAIQSAWRIDGSRVHWRVHVPANTTATAYVPGDLAPRELGPGAAEFAGSL